MIPLAPGPGTLEPMSWAWLTGTPALLVMFIAAVISIPASVVVLVQIVQAVRRAMSRHAEARAAKPALAPAAPDAASYKRVVRALDRKGWEPAPLGPYRAALKRMEGRAGQDRAA